MNLIEKYENYGFLDNVKENKKEELSQLFENFTNYLLNIGEEKLQWGKCDFSIIFIPLIRKLYTEYGETDYIKVYEDFKTWYETDGVDWEKTKENIDLLDFVGLYLQHDSVHQKHEQIRQEILADEALLPKELRDGLKKLKAEFDQQKIVDDKYIEDNKHRKIVGYDERYIPIYEDEK